MNIILKEDSDFTWGEISNRHGIKFNCPILNDGTKLNPISEPKRDSIMYIYKESSKELIPVLILDGCYLDPTYHRVSNWWSWQELDNELNLKDKSSGYGGFFKPHLNFDVKIQRIVQTK